jgi:hypothetical protein
MSILTIVLINVLAASILVAILASVMLAARLLRRPFAEGHTHRQKTALRAQHRAEAAQRRPSRRTRGEAPWHPIQDV